MSILLFFLLWSSFWLFIYFLFIELIRELENL